MSTGIRVPRQPPRRQSLSTVLPGFAPNAPKRNVLVLLGYLFGLLLVVNLLALL
jgi:hypothetical protein